MHSMMTSRAHGLLSMQQSQRSKFGLLRHRDALYVCLCALLIWVMNITCYMTPDTWGGGGGGGGGGEREREREREKLIFEP